MNRILISDAVADACPSILQANGFQVDFKPGLAVSELLEIIDKYDGLIVRSATKVTQEVIERAKNLKVIARAGTGIDNINVPYAKQKGITVLNCKSANTISAAEHTFAMMIALARNVPQAYASMLDGKWQRSAFKGVELFGKILGIIGLGQIGKELAVRAQAFGMKVKAYDPLIPLSDFQSIGVDSASINELFSQSDFISVHIPLMKETKHFISDDQFENCNPNLRLINVARGGVIDEEALYRALRSGKIAGAALDVYEQEPPGNNPLIGLKNVVTTPHLGASTVEAQERIAIEIAELVVAHLNKINQ